MAPWARSRTPPTLVGYELSATGCIGGCASGGSALGRASGDIPASARVVEPQLQRQYDALCRRSSVVLVLLVRPVDGGTGLTGAGRSQMSRALVDRRDDGRRAAGR